MHIIIDARTVTDHFPGIGRYVASLACALTEIAPDQGICLLHNSSSVSTRFTLPVLPRIPCPVSPFSIRQQWIIPGILRRTEAILYHSPYYMMPYLPGIPTVLTCYDLIPLIYPQYFTAIQRLIYRITHRFALTTASTILAVSQNTKNDLIHFFHIGSERVKITPLAADISFRPQAVERVITVRKKYFLPEKYVLYFGSNKPHKNLQRLIEAWRVASFKFQLSSFKLVIAGHWDKRYPEAKQLTEALAMKDQVRFLGSVEDDDLPALYSEAYLFVFPSLYEGFGLPVLEAMACGVPVICSNVSSLPEVTGDAALLVDPLDLNALAAKIGQVLTDDGLRQEMRRKGLAQAEKFSWQQTARETLKVYAEVLNQL